MPGLALGVTELRVSNDIVFNFLMSPLTELTELLLDFGIPDLRAELVGGESLDNPLKPGI
jgi:hypothetical protein